MMPSTLPKPDSGKAPHGQGDSQVDASSMRPIRHGRSATDLHFLRRGTGLEFAMEVDWLRRHLQGVNGPILDLGCGNGAFMRALLRDDVIGMDANLQGLEQTQLAGTTLGLICAIAQVLPFARRSLGAICAQHLIEHLGNVRGACRAWFEALRPGGLLLVITPNGLFETPAVFEDPTHTHIFTRRELREVIEYSGLQIIDERTLGLPWFRKYQSIPGGWRLRRFVTGGAAELASLPGLRWRGQSLCCAARRPRS